MTTSFCEIPDMEGHLRRLLAQVPVGRVTTHGTLAEALGNRIAARWVGHFVLHHEHLADCPCHRVVRAEGQLGSYVHGGARAKAELLRREGVKVQNNRVDLKRFGFGRFRGAKPLEELRQVQQSLLERVSLPRRCRIPDLIGGVDVSYRISDEGAAGYALVAADSGELVWSTTIRRRVRFPYISTYLSFRELPVLLDLIDEVRRAGRLSRVLLVDGSGILHHRRAGIATHLGVVASLPTIGVTKKLLCGQVELEGMQPDESRPVMHQGRLAGVALRPTPGSRRPIFISPGHRLDVAFAEQVVRRVLRGRRLPEPLYWADRLSRKSG